MKRAPSLAHRCCFCARDVGEVELMFRARLSGIPAEVCSICVEFMGEVLAEHRVSPARAGALVEANNTVAAQQTAQVAQAQVAAE